jgi:hypothetical protein
MTPVLLVGTASSILLSIILVLAGVDTPSSTIIGLVAVAISLLLDLIIRSIKMEQKLIEATGLSREVAGEPQLFNALSSMATNYRRVMDGAQFRLFTERATDVLAQCQGDLHNLVEGYMVLPPLSQFSFGLKGLDELRQSLKATSYVEAEAFWNSPEGIRYFQANVELVDRGVHVTRIFIGDRATIGRVKPVIQRQRKAGMHVMIAPTEEIPRELCEDYLVGDDSILVQLLLTREGAARAEKISVDVNEVRRSLNNFARLVGGAYEYEQIFPEEPNQRR